MFSIHFFLYQFMMLFCMMNSFASNLNFVAKVDGKNMTADPAISAIQVSAIDCQNNFILTADLLSTANPTDRIEFYLDQNLTQVIANTTIQGVEYVLSNSGTTFNLNVKGLNTKQTYYVGRVNSNGELQTPVTEVHSIEITPKNIYSDAIASTLVSCGSANLLDAIQVDDSLITSSDIIEIYDVGNNKLTSTIVNQSGLYRINIISNGCTTTANVTVTIQESPNLVVTNPQAVIMKGETFTINATTTNSAIISYFNVTNNVATTNKVGPFAQAGTYIIRVEATKGSCKTTEFVTIVVNDDSICKVLNERIYANNASKMVIGIVWNLSNAADANPSTFATLSLPLGLAGLLANYIDLEFAQPVPKGKLVTVKLGNEYGGLDLPSGLTLTTLVKNSNGNLRTS